jgi:WD40 repeat protein
MPPAHQVQLWDVETGKEKYRYLGAGPGLQGPRLPMSWAVLNETGRWILCGSQDELIRLYDGTVAKRDPPAGGCPMPSGLEYVGLVPNFTGVPMGDAPPARQAPGGAIPAPGLPFNPPPGAGWRAPAFPPSKYPYLVTGRAGGDIVFTELDKQKDLGVCRGHSDRIWWVAFSKDGHLAASASSDRTVRIWDLHTFKELAELPHGEEVYAVTFTPDGKRVISGAKDGKVRVWDYAKKQELRVYARHAEAVTSIACSADGKRFLTGSMDKTVKLWAMPK